MTLFRGKKEKEKKKREMLILDPNSEEAAQA